jgi:hypothetical protein
MGPELNALTSSPPLLHKAACLIAQNDSRFYKYMELSRLMKIILAVRQLSGVGSTFEIELQLVTHSPVATPNCR